MLSILVWARCGPEPVREMFAHLATNDLPACSVLTIPSAASVVFGAWLCLPPTVLIYPRMLAIGLDPMLD